MAVTSPQPLFNDTVDYTHIPSHLRTSWRNMHVRYVCVDCGLRVSQIDNLRGGYACTRHPRRGTRPFPCCGERKFDDSGCTPSLHRVPPTHPLDPPLYAVPAIFVQEASLCVHPSILHNLATRFVPVARDARFTESFDLPHANLHTRYIPIEVIAQNKIEMPMPVSAPRTQIDDVFAYALMTPADNMDLSTNDGDALDEMDPLVLNMLDRFEPVFLFSMYAQRFAPAAISTRGR